MECILLGTGGMMPMPHRLLTSLAVRVGGRCYLFDGGEGVQIGAKRTHLGMRGLTVIAISHLHADHCLGLPGLLMLRAQLPNPAPLTILGPPGISRFINQNHELLGYYTNYPIRIIEWQDGAEAEAILYLNIPVKSSSQSCERSGTIDPDTIGTQRFTSDAKAVSTGTVVG